MALPQDPGAPSGEGVSPDLLGEVARLQGQGHWADAVALLTRAARARADPDLVRRLVRLRRDAFRRTIPTAGQPCDARDAPAIDPATGLPTLLGDQLSAPRVRAGILSRGVVRVRGLLTGSRAAMLRAAIDSAFEARERVNEGDTSEEASSWYEELEDVKDGTGRPFVADGGVYAGDSPRGLSALVEAYSDSGIDDLTTAYFGERPALSFEKTVLRRVPPSPGATWHQDGAFLGGAKIRSLNLWIALSRCGRSAPGLQILPRRVEHIVPGGGLFDWDIADGTLATAFPDVTPVLPELEIGDALLFDHLCVHRTGQAPGMTEPRYALESWFFAPSAYPDMLTGLLI